MIYPTQQALTGTTLRGDVSGLSGDLDKCEITSEALSKAEAVLQKWKDREK
jgi:hypothetical protein